MGKTRFLFKKARDTKGTFQGKTGTIKDKNGMNLTEGKNTQNNFTIKILMTQITTKFR